MIVHNVAQMSYEWQKLKLGKVSGTRLKDLVGSKKIELACKLIAEIETQEIEEGFINDKMQRGIDTEPIAADKFTEVTGIELMEVGFIESTKWGFIGNSPDRYFKNDFTEAVEIKCPDTKKHVYYIVTNNWSEYKHQIASYFIANNDLEKLHFMSFDPRFTIKPYHITTIYRDEIDFEYYNKQIDAFAEILDEKYELIKF